MKKGDFEREIFTQLITRLDEHDRPVGLRSIICTSPHKSDDSHGISYLFERDFRKSEGQIMGYDSDDSVFLAYRLKHLKLELKELTGIESKIRNYYDMFPRETRNIK